MSKKRRRAAVLGRCCGGRRPHVRGALPSRGGCPGQADARTRAAGGGVRFTALGRGALHRALADPRRGAGGATRRRRVRDAAGGRHRGRPLASGRTLGSTRFAQGSCQWSLDKSTAAGALVFLGSDTRRARQAYGCPLYQTPLPSTVAR